MTEVLQKLLLPSASEDVSARGYAVVGGPVARAGDVARWTPEQLLRAFKLDGEGSPFGAAPVPFVDVLRFPVDPLMSLSVPPMVERPWPTYPTGFVAADDPAPVWLLEQTRVPVGTEFWRVRADGNQLALSVYDGAARGWRGAQDYVPPVQLVGTRARWRGLDVPADLVDGGAAVELVVLGSSAPDAFEQVRPDVWVRRVPVAECESVFALRMTCTWRDVPCLIVQSTGREVTLVMLGDDPEHAARLGGVQVEPGTFMARAPLDEIADQVGTMRELPPVGA